jgi:hypothetical protein
MYVLLIILIPSGACRGSSGRTVPPRIEIIDHMPVVRKLNQALIWLLRTSAGVALLSLSGEPDLEGERVRLDLEHEKSKTLRIPSLQKLLKFQTTVSESHWQTASTAALLVPCNYNLVTYQFVQFVPSGVQLR